MLSLRKKNTLKTSSDSLSFSNALVELAVFDCLGKLFIYADQTWLNIPVCLFSFVTCGRRVFIFVLFCMLIKYKGKGRMHYLLYKVVNSWKKKQQNFPNVISDRRSVIE